MIYAYKVQTAYEKDEFAIEASFVQTLFKKPLLKLKITLKMN